MLIIVYSFFFLAAKMKGRGFKIFEKQRIRMKRFTRENEAGFDEYDKKLKSLDDVIRSKTSITLVSLSSFIMKKIFSSDLLINWEN